LIGYSRADLGLGQSIRYVAKALKQVNFPFLVRSFNVKLKANQTNSSLEELEAHFCKYPINLIAINPDMIYQIPMKIQYSEWARRYNIAHWFWELEKFPQAWHYCLPMIDEIWVNTEFNAAIMRQVHSTVIKIPFAVEFPTPDNRLNRKFFGLPDEQFLFINTFDFNSSVQRKNPLATIEAFQKAFQNVSTPVGLIVKSNNGHQHPHALKNLRDKANNDPRIIFIDEYLPTENMLGLLNCADCYISLHRSEGLGLGLAESMYLGKPVIATAYSGNMEFMNEHNSFLIPYKLITVNENDYPHNKNQFWADPDHHQAVKAMQIIFQKPEFRLRIAEQSYRDMRRYYSFSVMGKAIEPAIRPLGYDWKIGIALIT
jgi:glycosyltransferase involved in cell wall biosynthesis